MRKQVWWNTRKIQNVSFFSKALFLKKNPEQLFAPLCEFSAQCREHTLNIHTTETWRKSWKINQRQSWKIIHLLSDGTFPYWSLKNKKKSVHFITEMLKEFCLQLKQIMTLWFLPVFCQNTRLLYKKVSILNFRSAPSCVNLHWQ